MVLVVDKGPSNEKTKRREDIIEKKETNTKKKKKNLIVNNSPLRRSTRITEMKMRKCPCTTRRLRTDVMGLHLLMMELKIWSWNPFPERISFDMLRFLN